MVGYKLKRELYRMLKMFRILYGVLVIWVYITVKTNVNEHLVLMHLTVCKSTQKNARKIREDYMRRVERSIHGAVRKPREIEAKGSFPTYTLMMFICRDCFCYFIYYLGALKI